MPHRHYCCLSDSAYLPKFLALYDSLKHHASEPFTLHYLAMDNEAFWIASELKLENVAIIPLRSFETAMKMADAKASRGWVEYLWTAASSLMEFLLGFGEIHELTYLDADVFFYADPKGIYDQIRNRSIGITPHHFGKETPAHVLGNGNFNVGVVVARNNFTGRQCIARWAAQTRDWCFAKVEPTRFGDQKYLDEWPELYGDECAILGPGINLGPWAVSRFDIYPGLPNYAPSVMLSDGRESHKLIAYHMHEYRDPEHLTNWPLKPDAVALIYKPYVMVWRRMAEDVERAQARLSLARSIVQQEAERV